MVRIRSPRHAWASRLPLAVTASLALIGLWPGRSTSQPLTFGAPHNYATGSEPYLVVLGDLNGDGRPDVVTANYSGGSGNSVSVLLNAGSGVFGAHADYVSG